MKFLSTALFIALISFSCNAPSLGIFTKKTLHEKHAETVEDRYKKTPEGRQWLDASTSAIDNPYPVSIPYKQHGSFLTDRSRAMGLEFAAKRGEQVRISIERKSGGPFVLFADLFRKEALKKELVFAADTSELSFFVNVDEAGDYVLRLQPELFHSGDYTVSITAGPSLTFPVSGNKAKAGSFWGAARDGGKRKHEGVDIFAPKGTPVIASADGIITSVKEGGIGGKTVWLRPSDRNISLYYAHLDEQSVQAGQRVKKGDLIGTVGNTGNARTTPPHLHFGVYGYGGATDPWPFVNKTVKQPAAVPKKKLDQYLQLTKAHKTLNGVAIKSKTIMIPLAVNAKGYVAELPGGELVQTPFNIVKQVSPENAVVYNASTQSTIN